MVDGTDDTTVIDTPNEEPTVPAEVDQATESDETAADTATVADSADDDAAESDSERDEDSDDEESDDDDDSDDEESDNPLEVEGEVAADYLEELLDIADLDGDIDTYVENGRAHVSVITESDVLVGADGEVLEALQELSRLAVITETGTRSRLMLDVGGFRERRRKALTELAGDAVEEVKSSGESVRLKPMNPFERKIVHDVVAGAGLTSESEGEEPQRRVVILPAR
ncbi:spoIIIJ-associated protein [Microlunatus soli]|uniref:SpoIIIJ-associated protein n=1 Tax=Microlunatus soli TaxID=630515 RepID=A0A1H1UK33_9ACTN|nr:spoIIIJ-associated protein [Microlunatus soli]